MAKKYSKNEMKRKSAVKFLIAIFTVILIICVSFFIFVGTKNYIVSEKIDDSAKNQSDDVVKSSTPIVINNVIVGAVYNGNFVASQSYYFRNDKKNIDVDVYTEDGKKGKYQLTSQEKDTATSTMYAYVNTPDRASEFIAVASSDKDIMPEPAKKEVDVDNVDIKEVKKALGIYGILNSSVKINSIHDVTLNQNNIGRIFCITNEVGKYSGGYSAVIYIANTGESKIIKYSYVKNFKKSSDWPIYSFKFIADLNNDGTNEVIIQEVKEFEAKYDIIEFKNDNFIEVLSSEFKFK